MLQKPNYTDRAFWAVIILAILSAWRLPAACGLTYANQLFSGNTFSIILAVAMFYLYRKAFSYKNIRLKRIAYIIGLFFSACTLIGTQMELAGAFIPLSWGGLWNQLFLLLLLGMAYGSALVLIYRGALMLNKPVETAKKKQESFFSRLSGNWLVLFLFFLSCWVPVWLAFWPGTFRHDSVTQFFTYLDNVHNTHHPLLHTLLLGACMMFGINIDHRIEGGATTGVAICCGIHMVLLAMMLAYACGWLRRKKAPIPARVLVTLLFALFPFYSLWTFCAQKDILFGGLVLLFLLEVADLWTEPEKVLHSPLRILKFIIIATLMMLMRHNGIYALCLFLPFAVVFAKLKRLRVVTLLTGCVAAYFLANGILIGITEATIPSKREMLSIPLQQIARTLIENPAATMEDTEGVLDALYGFNPGHFYAPKTADPVKWAADDDEIDDRLSQLLSLWVRLGLKHPKAFLEAFFAQNSPYYLPGADMLAHLDLNVVQMDLFPVMPTSYIPALRSFYEAYNQSLTFLNLTGVRLLSDTAFFVWLCIAALGYAIYQRQKQWITCLVFLLAIWVTCLLGPVALIRYMLGFFYCIPVILAAMSAPACRRSPVERIP